CGARPVPDPVADGERQAAGLSGLGRLGAEAAGRDRRHGRVDGGQLRQRPPRPAHPGQRDTEAFEAARESVARLLNAPAATNIVFTKGGTEAINLVASSFGQFVQPGDEIIVSEMEHHSNIVPWHLLRERKGAVLKWIPLLEDGALDMAAYAELLGPKTRMVA